MKCIPGPDPRHQQEMECPNCGQQREYIQKSIPHCMKYCSRCNQVSGVVPSHLPVVFFDMMITRSI